MKLAENILALSCVLSLLFIGAVLTTSAYQNYTHSYLNDTSHWCDLCDSVTMFSGESQQYKNFHLCRRHIAEAVILGVRDPKLGEELER
jgi:hypothetical protein